MIPPPNKGCYMSEAATNEKIYEARSERLTLGGYKAEKKGLGFLEPDVSIQFENHVYRTSDKKVQAFIELTERFKMGSIKLIDDGRYNKLMGDLAANRMHLREETARRSGMQK